MSIALDGITLDDSMIWAERHTTQNVAQSLRRTLAGSAVVYVGALGAGVPITLQASSNQGWLRKSQADAVLARAAVPGGVYTLEYGSETFSVMFRHHEPPAVNLTPLLARQAHDAEDYFTGEIKLVTV